MNLISSHAYIHMSTQPVAAGSSFGRVLLISSGPIPFHARPLCRAAFMASLRQGWHVLPPIYDSKASIAKQPHHDHIISLIYYSVLFPTRVTLIVHHHLLSSSRGWISPSLFLQYIVCGGGLGHHSSWLSSQSTSFSARGWSVLLARRRSFHIIIVSLSHLC